jgi:hypothetical protein
MGDHLDLSTLDDPTLLSERRRVREQAERSSENDSDLELLLAKYNQEFDRRAAAAWTRK